MRWIRLLSLLLVILGLGHVSAQSDAVIALPISGNLLMAQSSERLLSLNTASGNVIYFTLPQGSVIQPSWNTDGGRIVHGRLSDDLTIIDSSSGSVVINITTFPNIPGDDLFRPLGWSEENDNILYVGKSPFIDEGIKIVNSFYIFEMISQVLSAISLSLVTGELLPSTIPLPTGISGAYLDSIDNIRRNPVYDEWVVLELRTTDLASLEDPNDPTSSYTSGELTLILLWNYATGDMLLANDIIPERSLSNPRWSKDGTQLSIEYPQGIYIVNFVPGANPPSISFAKHAPQQAEIKSWLGIDDLLINFDTSQQDTDYVYTIAQIIGDQWYEIEFFRLAGQDYPGVGVGGSDWHLTASEDEKHALSCLFDQAMPTRLSIGTRARVNFTDGTPLRVRAEPDFDATEIMQMPEGTEFDVIGGPACVNAASYYRFWQFELDDGTVGWAAEADDADYFVEVVE